jgi:LPXTG-motif cell wall-anchored protein
MLADTGASRSTLPYLGLAVSLMLLGVSAFLLIGRRRPGVR